MLRLLRSFFPGGNLNQMLANLANGNPVGEVNGNILVEAFQGISPFMQTRLVTLRASVQGADVNAG